LRGETIWQFFVLLINGLVFILIGLELSDIRTTIAGHVLWPLLWHGLIISLAVIVIRILWVYPATYLPRLFFPKLRRNDPSPNWRPVFIISWAGLRGVVSLASALALPMLTNRGTPFDHREEIIVIAFVVIIVTLFGQGLPLDWIITRLNIPEDDKIVREELLARRVAAQAALDKLDEIGDEMWVPPDHLEEMRTRYRHIIDYLPEGPTGELEELHTRAYLKLRGIARDASRRALIDLRNRGVIGDEARRRVESTLDLDELRLEV
jgi:CPA1 family monovalent cation:H+ antiporter